LCKLVPTYRYVMAQRDIYADMLLRNCRLREKE
jgi:hypothetical protein